MAFDDRAVRWTDFVRADDQQITGDDRCRGDLDDLPIAPRVRNLMQTILDRYNLGVEIVAINLQQGGVRPPEQVQAAFDDVLKAGQERERAKNEAQAYANDVVPRATGTGSRLKE